MKILETPLPGLLIVEPDVFHDDRGYFFEWFSKNVLQEKGIDEPIAQANHSFSKKGVLRGLHFQAPPFAQSKFVRCTAGVLFDVVVDIRSGSPSYGKWFGLELTAENKKMLFVPQGFAHGFYAISDCELLYLCGGSGYVREAEGGLRYDDKTVKIRWPFGGEPILNERDRSYPALEALHSSFIFTS